MQGAKRHCPCVAINMFMVAQVANRSLLPFVTLQVPKSACPTIPGNSSSCLNVEYVYLFIVWSSKISASWALQPACAGNSGAYVSHCRTREPHGVPQARTRHPGQKPRHPVPQEAQTGGVWSCKAMAPGDNCTCQSTGSVVPWYTPAQPVLRQKRHLFETTQYHSS